MKIKCEIKAKENEYVEYFTFVKPQMQSIRNMVQNLRAEI